MILTEKCKEKFEQWLYENCDKCQIKPQEEIYWQHFSEELTLFDIYEKLPNILQNALIIEFFDSVGIYIEIHYSKRLGDKFYCIINESINYNLTSYQDSRQEATIQAIKKANDLYNNTDKV